VTEVDAKTLIDRFRGALVGTAIGDALGAPVEGHSHVPSAYLESLHDKTDLTYTDDTAMTIGVARSLVEHDRFVGQHMAETFAAIHDREPWRGYGAGPPQVFTRLAQGVPWDRAARDLFDGQGSFGNGGAMRVAPVALHAFPDYQRTARLARLSASITHTHPLGLDGAAVQAVAISYALQTTGPLDPADLVSTLVEHVESSVFESKLKFIGLNMGERSLDELADVLGTGIAAHASVPTAVASYMTHPDSFAEAVLAAIGLGGDTDTIGAMTGAIAGARHGYTAIPTPWKGVEGADQLISLADSLASRVRQ
jgi:poly(ADP-ribose) glycohydrolase ARH3